MLSNANKPGLPTRSAGRRPHGARPRVEVKRKIAEWWSFCHFFGMLQHMKTTIDAAGRIVVPKPLRQELGLRPGQPLEIRAGDGRLEIEIASTPMQLRKRGKGLVAVPDAKLPPLTAEQVRDTLERVRR